MRFTAVLFAGAFAAFASAQSTTVSSSPSTTTDPVAASIVACINKCDEGDVDCTAHCVAVPNPNNSQVNATNDCVAACPQGNGTAADNLNYSNCVQGCIGKYYYSSAGGTPQTTGGSGSGSGSGASGSASTTATGTGAAATGSATGSGSGTASGTATGASASGTNAAEILRVGTTGVGLLGLLAAFMAL